MILLFSLQGKMFTVKVSEDREISFSSELTNNKYVGLEELAAKEEDQSQVELAKAIIRSLPTIDLVEKYIISEFARFGLSYIKTER